MFRRKRRESDFKAEIEAHLRLEEDALRADGLNDDELRSVAQRALGNRASVEEAFFERSRNLWAENLWRDLRFAFRAIYRERTFALFTILLIGLGVGFSTAMFAVFDAVALRKIKVPDPDSLVHIVSVKDGEEVPLRYAVFEQLRDHFDFARAMVAWTGTLAQITVDGQNYNTFAQYSSGDYYGVMGARPLLGRLLSPGEDGPVAVISDPMWRRLGSDPGIIGKVARAGPVEFTIVGVAPVDAHKLIRFATTDMIVPWRIGMLLESVARGREYRYNVDVTARLKPGITRAELQKRLETRWPDLIAATVPSGQTLEEWTRTAGAEVRVLPGAHGRVWSMDDRPRVTLTLFLLASLVSLTICSSLATLLLSRGLNRQTEFAVRMALGARRSHVLRHLVVELCVLASLGAGLALAVAAWLADASTKVLFSAFPGIEYGVAIDHRVIGYALILAATTAAAAQIVPALRLSNVNVADAIRAGARTVSARLGGRKVMIGLQVAASLILVSGSMLFVSTVQALTRVEPGFRPDDVLVVSLAGKVPWSEARPEYFHELLRRVQAIPSVSAAGLTNRAPMEMQGEWDEPIIPVDGSSSAVRTDRFCALPGLLSTLEIPLLAGRDFRESDTNAVIVTRELAQTLFPRQQAVSRHVKLGKTGQAETLEIVGVMGDVRLRSARQQHTRMAFVPCKQVWKPPQTMYAMSLVLRSTASAAVLERSVGREVDAMGKQVVHRVVPLKGLMARSMRSERALSTIGTGFGAFTLLLTCAGVYALISLAVTARKRELGIRMALGATRTGIVRLILNEAAVVTAIGAAAGIAASVILSRLYRSFLYGVSEFEPLLFGAACTVVAVAALLAALGPALRATRSDPSLILRWDR